MTMRKIEPMPTQPQVRKFFALAKDLGSSDERAKERAKTHFGVSSFKELTQAQLGELIERMEEIHTPLEVSEHVRPQAHGHVTGKEHHVHHLACDECNYRAVVEDYR